MKKNNVLVVDDEENILNSLKRALMEESFGVYTTTDYKEALDIVKNGEIKVVLSDHRMPGINGVDFLQMVKNEDPDIIRILFTGYADVQMAQEAINIGEVYRFVNKPWDVQDLLTTIRNALEKFDLVQENRRFVRSIEEKNKEFISLNEKLRNMYEAQKEFSSTVSHELRTPLASIKIAIDIVMSGTPGKLNAAQKDCLGKAGNGINRLHKLINNILDFSKLESGGALLDFQENDIYEVVKDVVDINKLVAEKKGLYLKIETNKETPKTVFDADRINQVLYNLVGNALKFTEKGGVVISITSDKEKNYVKTCIADTGEGVRKEDLPKLFQKFQQLGDPAKRRSGGTGLGLAICKEIIARHHGKIEVESELGKGTKVYFFLPIDDRRK